MAGKEDAVLKHQKSCSFCKFKPPEVTCETQERWVQCRTCEAWQHQTCALANRRCRDGHQFIAFNPSTRGWGASNLPRTNLSDHLERRLFLRLKTERQERATSEGKTFHEVPGVGGLVIRVISSVDKILQVKPMFLQLFSEQNYPAEFPYKSKVIALFQKIEGDDVLLFVMHVREFGSECDPPNQRFLCISSLDSVKFLTPQVKTASGQALSTFVYHEIVIGYLEYSKKRGFTSCCMRVRPPAEGNFILNQHPKEQKLPASSRLQKWFMSMLSKAAEETIVVHITNIYDHYFTRVGECKAEISAARLPHIDTYYWISAAEDYIERLYCCGAYNEEQIKTLSMKMLVHMLKPSKKKFILVHLHYTCSHCRVPILSGERWVCQHEDCVDFQLCERCYEAEQHLTYGQRHPMDKKCRHILSSDIVDDIPQSTEDEDPLIYNAVFNFGEVGLSLRKDYQFDTLSRAKDSTMMLLFHLHHPTASHSTKLCGFCRFEIDINKSWSCYTCSPPYSVCDICYQLYHHAHPLYTVADLYANTGSYRVIDLDRDIWRKIAVKLDHKTLTFLTIYWMWFKVVVMSDDSIWKELLLRDLSITGPVDIQIEGFIERFSWKEIYNSAMYTPVHEIPTLARYRLGGLIMGSEATVLYDTFKEGEYGEGREYVSNMMPGIWIAEFYMTECPDCHEAARCPEPLMALSLHHSGLVLMESFKEWRDEIDVRGDIHSQSSPSAVIFNAAGLQKPADHLKEFVEEKDDVGLQYHLDKHGIGYQITLDDERGEEPYDMTLSTLKDRNGRVVQLTMKHVLHHPIIWPI